MSDFASSLPIRTESNGDAAVKIVDGTLTSQALAVDASGKIIAKLDDSAGNGITSQVSGTQQALDVGINVAGVQVDPRAIRALTSADVVTVDQGTAAATHASPWWVHISDGTNDVGVLATGELKVAVTQPLPAGTNLIGEVKSRTEDGAGTAITSTLINAKQRLDIALAAEGVTGTAVPFDTLLIGGSDGTDLRSWAMFTSGIGKVGIFDSLGNAFSLTNPLPVTMDTVVGTSVNDYKDATAIAAAASDNHDYTVTAGKTLTLDQIEATGSGKAKMEIQIETGVATGIFNSKFVQFNSTSAPNMSIKLSDPIQVAAGVRVRVIMTNLDKSAQDLYSTISGTEN